MFHSFFGDPPALTPKFRLCYSFFNHYVEVLLCPRSEPAPAVNSPVRQRHSTLFEIFAPNARASRSWSSDIFWTGKARKPRSRCLTTGSPWLGSRMEPFSG